MKYLVVMISFFYFGMSTATSFTPKKFEEYSRQAYDVAVVEVLAKEKIVNADCFKIKARVVENIGKKIKNISFFVTRLEDFPDETRAYLVFLFKSKYNGVCGNGKEKIHVLNNCSKKVSSQGNLRALK